MFYTKYRPQKFSEILRPNDAADALSKQVSTTKTVHAYLFIGPRGTGKTTTARILAKALNCKNLEKNGDPCGECPACLSIQEGSFIDLIEIDAASNRGIDDIRDLKSKISLAPSQGKHKVYIIDEVHMLTKEAFNALLKTLEEPPRGVTFILCTTESNKVPDTIKSRCQIFHFKRASIKQLVEKLDYIVKEENADIDKKDLEKVAQASLGGFRDAETLLQQVLEGELSIDSFSDLETYEGYFRFTGYLWEKDVKEALGMIDSAFEEGLDLYVWVGEFLRYLRDILFIISGVDEVLTVVTGDLSKKIKAQAESITKEWVVDVIEEFISTQSQVKEAFIPQLPIELSVVKVCDDEIHLSNADVAGEKGSPDIPSGSNNNSDNNFAKSSQFRSKSFGSSSNKSRGSSTGKEAKNINKDVVVEKKDASDENQLVNEALEVNEEELTGDVDTQAVITIEEVKSGWEVFLQEVRKVNHSLIAIIKHGIPLKIEGSVLTIEVCYSFHKERLETSKNKRLISEALNNAYAKKLEVKCEINEGRARKLNSGESMELTDYNVVVPADEDINVNKEVLFETFDGTLPIM